MTTVNLRKNVSSSNGVEICVLGVIGSGKTRFSNALVEAIRSSGKQCKALLEPASKTNPYLSDFYKDPEKYGFSMQIYLLNKRFEQQLLAQSLCLAGENCVMDSSIFSDSCFVNLLEKDGVISKRDCDTYFELFQNMSRDCLYPTAVVYLDCTIEKNVERINKRMTEKAGRACESAIDKDYLYKLKLEIEQLVTGFQRYTHVIRLDWNEDLTQEQIEAKALEVYNDIVLVNEKEPIRCFLGVDG